MLNTTSVKALNGVLEDSWDGLGVSLSTGSWTLSLLHFLWPAVCISSISYIFSIWLLDIRKQHRFHFAYGSSFYHIFCTKCEFFDVFYRMMVYLDSALINSYHNKEWNKIITIFYFNFSFIKSSNYFLMQKSIRFMAKINKLIVSDKNY